MSVIVEEGKFYKQKDGRIVGPAAPVAGAFYYPWTLSGGDYTSDGRFYEQGPASTFDLVAEWVEVPASDPTLFDGLKRIYLSGPMKGYPQSNYPLFTMVAAQLRRAGHTVYNPAEFPHEEEVFPLRKAFAAYSKFICEEADTIVLLPGWEASLGVSAELALAKNCKLEVVEFKDLNLSLV